MTNYFYTDTTGQEHGPLTEQQLFELAAQGDIAPKTELTTDTGYSGTAEQIPGLFPVHNQSVSFAAIFTPHKDSLHVAGRKQRLILLASTYAGINIVVNILNLYMSHYENLWTVSLLCGCFNLYVYYLLILRLWQELPDKAMNKSPQTVALLSLIPIFAYYWMFIAVIDLQHRMNKSIRRYKEKKLLNTEYAVAACTGWLFLEIIGLSNAVLLPQNTLSIDYEIMWASLDSLWTAAACYIICNNALKFIDIKTSVENKP